ncbi:MAG TPA: hypothetical protein VIV66_20820, partial [Pyrinomonadaceae bacterium]
SLLSLDPYEFQRFRERGVMRFVTPMDLFDRDFPGHYLRLIRRVRTTVIALIPPPQGIRATLSSTGSSRAVIGGDTFRRVVVRRDPEVVALSSPANATGLFEMDVQADMLLPFEGLGVEAQWELGMPRAANEFDFNSVADVFMTYEFTALNNSDYAHEVLQQMSRRQSANRPFSFRHELSDAWYDLHNPDQTSVPMTVQFDTVRADFPSSLTDLRIQHICLYFARGENEFEIPIKHLRFSASDSVGTAGGSATTIDGMVNTRHGNGSAWTAMIGKSPVGTWELKLPNTAEIRRRFEMGSAQEVEDILFVITYSGEVPSWPA